MIMRRTIDRATGLILCGIGLLMSHASGTAAVEVPAGFAVEVLARRLNAATALATARDGRIFVADQTGLLRVWRNGRLLGRPALDLTGRVDDYWERGLIGLTFHPDFPQTPHLFVVYVAREPFSHHVVSRFTVIGDVVDSGSEFVLLRGDNQAGLGGRVPHGHQGGPIAFGPDGRLYVGLGEQTAGRSSQSLDSLLGKILRLNPDGGIPADNPFHDRTMGRYRSIWAIGLRNPFGMAFQPESGRLFVSDVGQTSFEEINEITRGANYGWPAVEGPASDPRFTNPVHSYPPVAGRCIVGGAFSPRQGPFPEPWRGRFFFADWAANWLKAIDPDHPDKAVTFAKGLEQPAALAIAPDGALLVLNRGTIWRDGKKWRADTGSLLRIRFGDSLTNVARLAPPKNLSATPWFTAVKPPRPLPALVEFAINHSPWTPGVSTRRWISVPVGRQLAIDENGEFQFPEGAVVVQQHAVTKTGRPFETHVHEFIAGRRARAMAYRWQSDGSEASLIEDGEVIGLPGDSAHCWFSPGTEPDLALDSAVIGFVLPVSPRQVNRANQLKEWRERGWVDTSSVAALPQLAALDDSTAAPVTRIRSYLDVNCSPCHRPGGPSRGSFDARFNTPLAAQAILNGMPVAGDLGIADARIVAPGRPDKSLLLQRLIHPDVFRMPPVALNDQASPVAPLLRDWIAGLSSDN